MPHAGRVPIAVIAVFGRGICQSSLPAVVGGPAGAGARLRGDLYKRSQAMHHRV